MSSRYVPFVAVLLAGAVLPYARAVPGTSSEDGQEQAISTEMRKLRSLPDSKWTKAVRQLARQIHDLPAGAGKTRLIGRFSNLVTEGDAGHDTLQMVASTMADVLRDAPDARMESTLAELARYEHCQVSLDSRGYRDALAKLEAQDRRREDADFTLSDLHGRAWSLKSLRGNVVLVNFWATWCPPCRREMPDLEALYKRFTRRGLVVLAISDEEIAKVQPFIDARRLTYPVLLDPGGNVHKLFEIEGIPKSFIYDREGKLVASAIDRRTKAQFLEMLKEAGIE